MKQPYYYLKAWYVEEDEKHENHEFPAYVGKDSEGNLFYTDELDEALLLGSEEEALQFKNEAEKKLIDVSAVCIYMVHTVHERVG